MSNNPPSHESRSTCCGFATSMTTECLKCHKLSVEQPPHPAPESPQPATSAGECKAIRQDLRTGKITTNMTAEDYCNFHHGGDEHCKVCDAWKAHRSQEVETVCNCNFGANCNLVDCKNFAPTPRDEAIVEKKLEALADKMTWDEVAEIEARDEAVDHNWIGHSCRLEGCERTDEAVGEVEDLMEKFTAVWREANKRGYKDSARIVVGTFLRQALTSLAKSRDERACRIVEEARDNYSNEHGMVTKAYFQLMSEAIKAIREGI